MLLNENDDDAILFMIFHLSLLVTVVTLIPPLILRAENSEIWRIFLTPVAFDALTLISKERKALNVLNILWERGAPLVDVCVVPLILVQSTDSEN